VTSYRELLNLSIFCHVIVTMSRYFVSLSLQLNNSELSTNSSQVKTQRTPSQVLYMNDTVLIRSVKSSGLYGLRSLEATNEYLEKRLGERQSDINTVQLGKMETTA